MQNPNYDTLIVELQKEGKAVASVSIKAEDLLGLEENFGQSRENVIENMIQVMEEGLDKK